LRLDFLVSFDCPVVVGLQSVYCVGRELDSGFLLISKYDQLRFTKHKILLDALNQLGFMNNLSTLFNGSLLCTKKWFVSLLEKKSFVL